MAVLTSFRMQYLQSAGKRQLSRYLYSAPGKIDFSETKVSQFSDVPDLIEHTSKANMMDKGVINA